MTATKKATNTKKPATPKADALASLREQNASEGFDTVAAAGEILAADDILNASASILADRLAVAPRIAADVHGVRGAAAKVAESLAAAHGIAKNAAEARVSRIVKCGRVLAAHPTLDALSVYAATNRMTGEQVEQAIAAKDAAAAAKVLTAKKETGKKAPGKRGAGKKAGSEKERTLREQVIAASKENASAIKKAEALTGEDPATVADDLALLISSLEATLKAAKVIQGGASAEKARRAAK
jgi:hypothetical protein